MKKANCPNCGGDIEFHSVLSAFVVCPYCASSIVRNGDDLENLGKMASLPEDMSPIQLYTSGRYQRVHFVVIGRLRISWLDGSWNEWYLAFDDGRQGWLADAQGRLAINFPSDSSTTARHLPRSFREARNFLGKDYQIEENDYEVVDVKEMTCLGSEGELPFKALVGRKSTNYDFANYKGLFASLEVSDDEQAALYLGEYVTVRELNLQNMRQFDGW